MTTTTTTTTTRDQAMSTSAMRQTRPPDARGFLLPLCRILAGQHDHAPSGAVVPDSLAPPPTFEQVPFIKNTCLS